MMTASLQRQQQFVPEDFVQDAPDWVESLSRPTREDITGQIWRMLPTCVLSIEGLASAVMQTASPAAPQLPM